MGKSAIQVIALSLILEAIVIVSGNGDANVTASDNADKNVTASDNPDSNSHRSASSLAHGKSPSHSKVECESETNVRLQMLAAEGSCPIGWEKVEVRLKDALGAQFIQN